MRKPDQVHEQLLSLAQLSLDGRPLGFSQALLSLHAEGDPFSWRCTLRGSALERVDRLDGEMLLRAETLDGRQVEGRVCLPKSEQQALDASQMLELEGVGPLLIEGREL
jgi:hypothetical protein